MTAQTTDPTISAVDVINLDAEKHDVNDLSQLIRAIRCKPSGTGGAVKIRTLNGFDRVTEIASGETLMIGATRVWATGTTATLLEGLV